MSDYTTYKAEDLLMDEGFLDYCKGNNKEAVKFWENFLSEHAEMRPVIDIAKKLYQLVSITIPAEEKNVLLNKVKEEIISGQYESETKETTVPVFQMSSQRKTNWRRYAAAAVIVGVIASSFFWFRSATNKPQHAVVDFATANFKETIHAGDNLRKVVQLPDGSVATLNYGSVLKIADNFNQSDRWLYLEGEGFFEVKKDAQRPFVVITSKAATTALGTSFKVRNYPGEKDGSVMLATGKVKVQSLVTANTRKEDIMLMPGEEATWNKDEQPVKSTFEQEMLLNWRNTKIIFDKANLAKITESLEFYYGVQVYLENKPRTPIAFTGKFYEKSLNEVLEAIAFTNKFHYSQKGNTVSIRFR